MTLEVEDNAHVLSDLGASRVPFWPKVRVLSKVKQIPQKVCPKSQIHFTAILNKYTNKFSYDTNTVWTKEERLRKSWIQRRSLSPHCSVISFPRSMTKKHVNNYKFTIVQIETCKCRAIKTGGTKGSGLCAE